MKPLSWIIIALVAINGYLMAAFWPRENSYSWNMLDVGQGDSSLVVLGDKKVLIDAGPGIALKEELSQMDADGYIDAILITHPEKDHFGGLIHIIDSYKIGAIFFNGRRSESREWEEFVERAKRKNIPLIVLLEGDVVHFGEDVRMNTLSPDKDVLQSSSLNDGSIVQLWDIRGVKVLSVGDIDSNLEKRISLKYDVDVDILKVAHHGSKYSSDQDFLKEVSPRISLIGVGEGNSYGHPAGIVLQRLNEVGSKIFRTDETGFVSLEFDGGVIKAYSEK